MNHKVVFVESASEMGGVEVSTVNLAKVLDRRLWHPIVVSPSEGGLMDACIQAGIPTKVISLPQFWSTSFRFRHVRIPNPIAWFADIFLVWRAIDKIGEYVASTHPDLVITKGLFAHVFGGIAARRKGIPCLWHLQDYISDRWLGFYRGLFGILASWIPDHIVVDGTPIKNQLPKRISSQVTVIYNAVDVDEFRPGKSGEKVRRELGIAPNATVVGNVARITPWKGQHYLLKAFIEIADQVPDAVLLFVGSALFEKDDYERILHRQVQQAGLNERVIFAGYRSDLSDVLAAVDIFAYTAVEKDTSPISVLSAMSQGLPIVAFDIAGLRDIIESQVNGVLVPTENVSELARTLKCLLEQPSVRIEIANNSRRKALEQFDLHIHASKMEHVMMRMTNRIAETV